VKYKAELEEILTSELCKQQQGISRVGVSVDGQFAIYNVGDCYTLRRLSPAAKAFLDHRDADLLREGRSIKCEANQGPANVAFVDL